MTDENSFGETLVRLEGLTKHFDTASGFLGGLGLHRDGVVPRPSFDHQWVRATDDVSFEIKKGETLGLVGESGCGKTTLARTVIKLLEPTAGSIHFKGTDLAEMSGEELRRMRQEMQIIFQDPQSSLDPRMKVGKIVEEPMAAHGLPKSDPAVETTAVLDLEGTGLTHDSVSVRVSDDVDLVIDPDPDGVVRVPIAVREKDNPEDQEGRGTTGNEEEIEIHLPDTLTADRKTDTTADESRIHIHVRVGASQKDLRKRRVRKLLDRVGLDPQHYNRYPHQFSGGQRQRINLARALSVDPEFIVCDEPTSALDASIQAQVLNTMIELQEEFGLTYLFISHDLSVIRHIADRVAVMYLGEIVELAETEVLYENPQHPYTEALLSAIPVPDPRASESRALLEGDVPSPIDPPSGCRFRTRCPKLIVPEEYDLTEREWTDIKEFMRAVERRTFDLEELLRDRFFNGVSLSVDAKAIVDSAIDLVLSDNWEEAAHLLDESFARKSICARKVPHYEIDSDDGTTKRVANCHLHRSE